MGVEIFSPNALHKRFLCIQGFKKIKFHYSTPNPDLGIQCVNFLKLGKFLYAKDSETSDGTFFWGTELSTQG